MKLFNKKILLISEFCRQNIFVKAILVNLVYMMGTVLVFKPFLSITDYQEWETIAGAYTGETDYHTKFVQFWYAKIIMFLTNVNADIPWYSVVYYLLIFISLSAITVLILKGNDRKIVWIIINLLLLFFSYEFYIYIQFTKVAAVVGTAGYFIMLSSKTRKRVKPFGVIMIFISFLVRFQIAEMLLASWVIVTIICEIKNYVLYKKVYIRRYIFLVVAYCAIASFFWIIPTFKYSNDSEREKWSLIWQWNEVRSSVQDFVPPDYDENIDFYSKEHISKNDLYIWYNWNNDYSELSLETGKKLINLEPEKGSVIAKATEFENVLAFFKVFPLQFLTIDVCYYCVIIVILNCLYNKKGLFRINILVQTMVLLAFEYYLFINERYLQHRVDVSIIFSIIICSMYFIENEGMLCEIRVGKKFVGICCILLICVPYKYYSDDISYISESTLKNNRNFFESTYNDEEHYYLIGNSRNKCASSQECYNAFEPIKAGIKRNIIMGLSPDNEDMLHNIGIENPFLEVINNKRMYFVLDDDTNDEAAWEMYFSEIYGEPVYLQLEKTEFDRNIYFVMSE